MRIVACEQGSDAWKLARSGKVTASRLSDVLAKIKSGEAKVRRDYKIQIVTELLTGAPAENGYVSADMQWGTEQEPFARAAYEIRTGSLVDQIGFVLHPTIDQAGASPDGLVGDDGIIQIKCPKSSTHLQYILTGGVPIEYVPQMCWELVCTGRQWCDFVSYDPRMPEHLQLFIARMEADSELIADYEQEVRQFLKEVNGLLVQLEATEMVG